MSFSINDPTELNNAILLFEQSGAIGSAHLFRALRDQRCALLPLLPAMSANQFKRFTKLTSHKPAIVLIGDDDGFDHGPAVWRLAVRVVRWARFVLLDAAGARVADYEAALVAAEGCGRALVVECCSATVDAWVALVLQQERRIPGCIVLPTDGPHPIAMSRVLQ